MKRRSRPFDYERRHEALAPLHVFRHRLLASAAIAFAIILVSLAIGVVGYRTLGRVTSWVDAFYAASMILGGMGPDAKPPTTGGKVFASLYALYSGVVLLASVGVLVSPMLHRVLHRFHLETEAEEKRG